MSVVIVNSLNKKKMKTTDPSVLGPHFLGVSKTISSCMGSIIYPAQIRSIQILRPP